MTESDTRKVRVLVLADCYDPPTGIGAQLVHLVLGCGDVPEWLLRDAAEKCSCAHIMAVKGNHDSEEPFGPGIQALHLKVRRFGGISLGGFNGAWQYKPRGYNLYSQDQASELLDAFPRVDVMVAHNSPFGIHERGDPAHQGFVGLRRYIHRVRPYYLIHGHQHVNREDVVEDTRVMGVRGFGFVEIKIPARGRN